MNRRSQWRAAVYRAPTTHKSYGIPNGVRVLLLRLSEDTGGPDRMRANGWVSVPRSRLAADLGVAEARITERMHKAIEQGWLSVVRHGRPGVTAAYQVVFPDHWQHR